MLILKKTNLGENMYTISVHPDWHMPLLLKLIVFLREMEVLADLSIVPTQRQHKMSCKVIKMNIKFFL
jgi:hypothetical protein